MKKTLLSILFISMAFTTLTFGQSIAVFNYAKTTFSDQSAFRKHSEKYWHPAVDKQIKKGNLISFQSLTHGWGNEWNFVDIYEAKDFATFEKAWKEIWSESKKNTPKDEWDAQFKRVIEHKDNIWSVTSTNRKK